MTDFLSAAAELLYGRLLIVLLIAVGLYFTFKTRAVQLGMLGEAVRVSCERGEDGGVSSFGALMVSTAARVGVGNIAGVSTAICLGGCGAVFWMWLTAIIGSATAFIEATLAQIFKRRSSGGFCGGPAWYIERAFHSRGMACAFCLCLIVTYGVGFNMLSSRNSVEALAVFRPFSGSLAPPVIGAALAAACWLCVRGGQGKIVTVSEWLVPLMAGLYIMVSLIVVLRHLSLLPGVISSIFRSAFDTRAAFSGFGGSCIMYGVRRGLFSNEAGIGSAPNAAAAASVSHPVKQGLAQMLSVFIDTLLICSATALMCLCSGASASEELSGMPYVQTALYLNFGPAGPVFGAFSLLLFAFTTMTGNFFYIDSCMLYLFDENIPAWANAASRLVCCLAIFLGACAGARFVWSAADVCMGVMCLINLPAVFSLRGAALRCLADYRRQRRTGRDPVYFTEAAGAECWSICMRDL